MQVLSQEIERVIPENKKRRVEHGRAAAGELLQQDDINS